MGALDSNDSKNFRNLLHCRNDWLSDHYTDFQDTTELSGSEAREKEA